MGPSQNLHSFWTLAQQTLDIHGCNVFFYRLLIRFVGHFYLRISKFRKRDIFERFSMIRRKTWPINCKTSILKQFVSPKASRKRDQRSSPGDMLVFAPCVSMPSDSDPRFPTESQRNLMRNACKLIINWLSIQFMKWSFVNEAICKPYYFHPRSFESFSFGNFVVCGFV